MRKLNRLRRTFPMLLLLTLIMRAGAQENGTVNITTTAVPFLRLSPDARSGGMGDAGIALSPDANSGFYNLAKISFADNKAAIGATYTPWLKQVAEDMYLATLAGFLRLSDNQSLSASFRYFSAGDVTLIDYGGNKLQTTRPREYAFDLGYARKLSNKLGIAAALRYINSRLATGSLNGVNYKAGTSIAGDLSLYYNGLSDKGRGWTAGFSLSNLGAKISYTDDTGNKDFLPASMGVGAGYTEVWDEQNKITFALDIIKLLVPEIPANVEDMPAYRSKGVVDSWFDSFGNQAWQLGFGGEYGYNNQFFMRLGYNSKTYSYGNWQYLTTGVGIRFNTAAVNFSYLIPMGARIDRNPLSNTVRFGVLFGWPDK